MFVLSYPMKTLVVGRMTGPAKRLFGKVEELGATEICINLKSALARVNDPTARPSAYCPIIEPIDNDRSSLNPSTERIVRISAGSCIDTGERRTPKVNVIAAVVIFSPAAGTQVLEKARAIAQQNVGCVLVTSEKAKSSLNGTHSHLIDKVLSYEDRQLDSKLTETVRDLRRLYARLHRAKLNALLSNGTTSFLSDPIVSLLIDTASQEHQTEEVYLSLDPPGVLVRGATRPPEFILICDDDYRQSLREIAEHERGYGSLPPRGGSNGAKKHPSFSGDVPPASSWTNLLKGSRRTGTQSQWLYKRMPADSILPAISTANLPRGPLGRR